MATHTFASQIEVLPLEFREYLKELLEEANKLGGNVIFVLSHMLQVRMQIQHRHDTRTLALGTPWEKPVPTGCSTHSTLDRFVQLNSLGVGLACPHDQLKGYNAFPSVNNSESFGRSTYSVFLQQPF